MMYYLWYFDAFSDVIKFLYFLCNLEGLNQFSMYICINYSILKVFL